MTSAGDKTLTRNDPSSPVVMTMVRPETESDASAVRVVNQRAFAGPTEARIVDAIRSRGHERLSLVAVQDDRVVGHILFSPVEIVPDGVRIRGMGLAPMAVEPARQRQGIGSSLVREGLRRLDEMGCLFVVVVGHPEYYPRFGFEPASRFGVRPLWDGIPDEAFLIRIRPGAEPPPAGLARYLPEFDDVS